MIAVVKGSLSSGYVVVFDLLKSAHRYDVSEISPRQGMANAYVRKKHRYDTQMSAKTMNIDAVAHWEI